MTNTDMLTGWVDGSGVAHMLDGWGLAGHAVPQVDSKQDFSNVVGWEVFKNELSLKTYIIS